MVKVMHVQGKDLKDVKEPYQFLNGDVYVIDDSKKQDGTMKDASEKPKVYIWLGSKAFADDRGVGAWAAKQLDIAHAEIDTPGFLKHVDVNYQDVDYAMFRVWDTDLSDGSSTDDIEIKEVPITKSSLKSDDAFVIDGWDTLYVWVGKDAQVGEKMAADRLARKFDVDRKRTPIVYTIYEGDEPKGFYDFIKELEEKDPKKMGSAGKQVDPGTSDALNKKSSAPKKEKKEKKKGFFSRLFGR